MVKSKDREALMQRNTRRKKKQEFDKYKAFYTHVFMQHPEIVHCRTLDGGQNESIFLESVPWQ